MTRPGNDTHRTRSGRPSGPRQMYTPPPGSSGRRPPPVGRSPLWDEQDTRQSGPQPLKASWDPVERTPRPPNKPRPTRQGRRRSAVGWFVHRYGWRAYAIPVLIALTVIVIVQVGKPPVSTAAAPSSVAPAVVTVISGVTETVTMAPQTTASAQAGTTPRTPSTGNGLPATANTARTTAPTGSTGPVPTGTYQNLTSAALPPGASFVAKGKDTWHLVKGTTAPMGSGPTKYTYAIAVEDGVENTQADQEFASLVDNTLADPRSWIGSGSYTLQRVDSGTPSFTISLTSQMTVRENALCGWEIQFEASCYARNVKRVAINDARWTRGAVSFNGDLGSYRVYAINHEVGHALGFMHQPCATNGGLAPVMMQQSWSTANDDLSLLNPQLIPMDGKVCKFNPYPYPLGSPSGVTTPAAQSTASKPSG
ncbi:hypothetical protein ABIB25_000435 [Nakamurella sp. UYEF19]|uniref:DUF3152 domain-containing protein n=1 Tax=Nakamurella sp. UYEF19 TaxID=1756392 RepID=UPI0033927F89